MEYTCYFCNTPFTPKYPPSKPESPFCSLSCGAKHQNALRSAAIKADKEAHPRYVCSQCSTPFNGSPSNKERPFCSQSCAATYNNKIYVKRKPQFNTTPGRVERSPARSYIPREPKFDCLNCGAPAHKSYCSLACHRASQLKNRIDRWLLTGITGGAFKQAAWVRAYIFREQQGLCAVCSLPNEWNGAPLTFILDHINGDASNHAHNNLRLICSNCDSQLPTYKNKNKHSSRKYRRDRYAAGGSY